MQTIDDLLSNKLYQYIDKEDLDPHNELTNENWADFINKYENTYAELASELADNLMDNYKIYDLNKKES
jgi:arsenate reductase-like glutaredoxin family protein